jgi:acid phosphatase (class A)
MGRHAISSIAFALSAGLCTTARPARAEPSTYCEPDTGSPETLQTLQHGLLEGYLATDAVPDSLRLLPAHPEKGSIAYALDVANAQSTFPLRGSPRWQVAAIDADLNFPGAAAIYSCALGVPITKDGTPRLYTLLRRTLTDAGLATYRAKNHYQRPRPFMVNGEAICTPEEETLLRSDGSYPSGHTAAGWAWALVLSEIAPERRDDLLARGMEYGKSRYICNVHWLSDVQASQIIASGTVAQLHADPVFRADLRAAQQEVQSLRMRGVQPNGDCELERKAFQL